MSDDNDHYAVAGYREHQEGRGVRDPDAAPHTGIVRDPKVSRYLAVQEEHYDPSQMDRPGRMPGTAQDLSEVQQIRGIAATETAREALENGDFATLKHLQGDQDMRPDISGIKAIGMVDEIIDSPAPVVVLLGEMGAGKTDMAGLIAQRKAAKSEGKTVVASNIRTLQETTPWVHGQGHYSGGRAVVENSDGQEVPADGEVRYGWVRDFPTFKEWMEQDGDPVDETQANKIFIGDEFSVSAGGQGSQGYQTATKLAKAIYLARKYQVTLIIIAHGPRSVHPLVWRVGTIIKKVSKKKAKIADRIEGDSLADIQGEIGGIPPTDWRFDTADTAPWSWTASDEDTDDLENDEIADRVALWTVRECYQRGLSARETAKFVPYSRDYTSRRYRWIRDDDFPHEEADSVEEIIA